MGNSVNKNSAPLGVKIIGIVYFIGAVLSFLAGIFLIAGVKLLLNFEDLFNILGSEILIFLGVILILIAVLYFFIGRGLFKGRSWARIIVIVFSVLGFVFSLIGMFSEFWSNFISFVINLVFAGYLFFSREVKNFF